MSRHDWFIDGTLDLSYRAHGRLRYAKITKLSELTAMTERDMLDIPRLGPKILAEIKNELAKRGLRFAEER